MNKNYVSPKAEIKKFISEDVITTSGTGTNKLTALATKTFNVADSDAKWGDAVK